MSRRGAPCGAVFFILSHFSSGSIQFAHSGQWDALLSYCADDVRILCDLYWRRFLNNPRFHRVIDLRDIAHASKYKDKQDAKQDDQQNDKLSATKEQEMQTEPGAELLEPSTPSSACVWTTAGRRVRTQIHVIQVFTVFPAPQDTAHRDAAESAPGVDCPFIVLTETKFSSRCIPVWIGTLLT